MNKNHTVYKVFSRQFLTDEILNKLFISRSHTFQHKWNAYPQLVPLTAETILPFHLSDSFYYVNAMEFAFSVMESESLGGQNVAQLIVEEHK